MDQDGVSPVIGIVLLVAITFILAATVFLVVNDIGQDRDVAPNIAFKQDGDQFTVMTTPEVAITWEELDVQCSGALSGVDEEGEEVNAGDSFTCTGAVSVVHTSSDSLIYDLQR